VMLEGDVRRGDIQRSVLRGSKRSRGPDGMICRAFDRSYCPYQAPNANAHAERFVRSIREECLDRLILFGERRLISALDEFTAHYHRERNHQGLGNRLIVPISGRPVGSVAKAERCPHRRGRRAGRCRNQPDAVHPGVARPRYGADGRVLFDRSVSRRCCGNRGPPRAADGRLAVGGLLMFVG
jgi:hypothetical protein